MAAIPHLHLSIVLLSLRSYFCEFCCDPNEKQKGRGMNQGLSYFLHTISMISWIFVSRSVNPFVISERQMITIYDYYVLKST